MILREGKLGGLVSLCMVFYLGWFVMPSDAAGFTAEWELVETGEQAGYLRWYYRDRVGNILVDFHLQQETVERPFRLIAYFNRIRQDTFGLIEGYRAVSVQEFDLDTQPVIRHDYRFPSAHGEDIRAVGVWTQWNGILWSLFFYCMEQSYHRWQDPIEAMMNHVLATTDSLDTLSVEWTRAQTTGSAPEVEIDQVKAFLADFERARLAGDFAGLLNLYADPYIYISELTDETVTYRIGEWALRLQENLARHHYRSWQHIQPEVEFPEPDRAMVRTEREISYTREEKDYRFRDRVLLTLVRGSEGWKLHSLRIFEVD